MKSLTRWFIENPVAANLLMIMILVAGIATMFSIRVEGLPKVEADTITIETVYLDMTSKQVDEGVTQKIEQTLEGMPGIKRIHSISHDGLSVINVRKIDTYDLQQLLDEIRVRVSSLVNLPKGAEKPNYIKHDWDKAALYVQVFGHTDTLTLQTIASNLKRKLLAQAQISKVEDWGKKDPELSIEIKPELLQKYQLSMQQVLDKIHQASLVTRSGVLRTDGGLINIRSDNQAYYYQDFANILIIEQPNGNRVNLGDIAEIVDGYLDVDLEAHFNGTPTVGLKVLVGRKENLLNISPVVQQVVEDMQKTLPQGVELEIWGDSSIYTSGRLELLEKNAIQGLILVFLLLALFLNLKVAFWVAAGIPVAILGAVAVMGTSYLDYSINDLTTFGLIVALGIVVDDAVVVGESVYAERQKNPDVIQATDDGVRRIAVAAVFGVLTTMAAFSSLLMVDNNLGKLLASFAAVVIFALIFSLIESKLILPAHLAQTNFRQQAQNSAEFSIGNVWKKVQDFFQARLEAFTHKVYLPFLKLALDNRYAVFMVFLSAAIVAVMLLEKGYIRSSFLPEVPGQYLEIDIDMDQRTPFALVQKNSQYIEESIEQLNYKLQKEFLLDSPPIMNQLILIEALQIEAILELTPVEQRSNLSSEEIQLKVLESIGVLEGVRNFDLESGGSLSAGFRLNIFSIHEHELEGANQQIQDYLKQIDGISNVRDSSVSGKPELQLKLKPEAMHLGFSIETMASQVSAQFSGVLVQRMQRDQEEVRITLRGHQQSRNALDDLMHTQIRSETGNWLPLQQVAEVTSSYTKHYIERRDREEILTIKAKIDKSVVSPSEVYDDLRANLFEKIKAQYPNIRLKGRGELEDVEELERGLVKAFIFIVVLIYALLAIPLKSYTQPIIILTVLPFGFIGALIGHWVMDLPLTILSFFGMLALTGILVNDSLVLITRFNQNRAIEKDSFKAILDTGQARLRAIFLTTATTVAGLGPMMFETSEHAQYLIPAAVSIAYGLLFATLITLILIPVMIAISRDISNCFFVNESETKKVQSTLNS